jgi:hypothetical protein
MINKKITGDSKTLTDRYAISQILKDYKKTKKDFSQDNKKDPDRQAQDRRLCRIKIINKLEDKDRII